MDFVTFTVKDTDYKLRINTRGLIQLEKQLGVNPLQVFFEIEQNVLPKLSDMAVILHSMLQALNHGITIDKTYDIIDDYFAEGHNMFELVPIFVEVFQNGGFISNDLEEVEVEERKN